MRHLALTMLAGAVIGAAACGGSDTPTVPPVTTTTTVAPQPSPSPSAAPSPSPSPVSQTCQLDPGPVARLAISPRGQRTDGVNGVDMRVRALPNFDEVWCLDKDKEHVIDFNANQRNAAGRECCYLGDAIWTLDDPSRVVVGSSSRHDDALVFRYNVNSRGATATFSVQAELDGIRSFPWQSGSGYRQEPLRVQLMSLNQMNRECTCIYSGNGVYGGAGCPKL